MDESKVTMGWFLPALFLLFLTLKLTHVIDWSWWWVTVPLWGPVVLILGLVCIVGLVAGIGALVEGWLK